MSEANRDFSTFYLEDNVYQLADGLIPEVAERFDMKLSEEPNIKELGDLVGRIGKNKVLRDNEEVAAIDLDTQVAFVERSGVQTALNRSLWTPEKSGSVAEATIMTGAVANWMDRGMRLIANRPPASADLVMSYAERRVIMATGNRVMDTPTEKANGDIARFLKATGRFPTETEYAQRNISHSLSMAGILAEVVPMNTSKGDEIARDLFTNRPELLSSKLVFARVANAGVQLAVQMRTAAREINPDFDADPENPQVFIQTDAFPIAKNAEEEGHPARFQKAATALRQTALTARMIHKANGGE